MKRRADGEEVEQVHGDDAAAAEDDKPPQPSVSRCPYLDTVNRALLDFDMSPTCSVTLSRLNVYCCLVCGKFFQGRGLISILNAFFDNDIVWISSII